MKTQGRTFFFGNKKQKTSEWLLRGGWPAVYAAIVATVMAVHLPEIVGQVSCNPILGYAGMLSDPLHRALPGRCTLDANDGITLQALGGRAAEMWLHGRLPWWNTHAGLGLPLAAEAQPAAFFLPFVLVLHWFAGLLILKITLQMLAGIFMIALCRELGLGRAAGCVGGVLFALNGSFAWFAHSPILPIAFLPALAFGLERCRTRAAAEQAGGPAWVALALGFSLVAGHPETAFMDGLLAAVWAAVAVLRVPAGQRWALMGKIGCGGLAGLALAAPAWLSFLDYARIAGVGVHGFVILNHLAAKQSAVLLMPGFFGPPYADGEPKAWTDSGGNFGAALAMLAVLGTWSGARLKALRWAMAGWIVFWLCVFFGVPVAHAIWRGTPVVNQVQVTRYAMPSLECAAALLAALAVDDWRKSGRGLRAPMAALVVACLAAAALVPAAQAGRLWSVRNMAPLFHVAAVLQATSVLAALGWLLAARRVQALAAIVVLLVALDATANFMLPEFAGVRDARPDLAPLRFLQSHAGTSRIYTMHEQIPVNYPSWFGVAQIQADSVPYATAWDDAAKSIGGYINMSLSAFQADVPGAQLSAFRAAAPALRAAGVRYVVSPAPADPFAQPPEPGMVRVFADAGTHIYEMAGAAAYLEVQGGRCTLSAATRDAVHASCAAPASLLRRELRLPGWHASINARKAAVAPGILRGQQEFQLVALPAGEATVRWWYSPPHAALMAWLAGLGAAATLAFATTGIRPVRRADGA